MYLNRTGVHIRIYMTRQGSVVSSPVPMYYCIIWRKWMVKTSNWIISPTLRIDHCSMWEWSMVKKAICRLWTKFKKCSNELDLTTPFFEVQTVDNKMLNFKKMVSSGSLLHCSMLLKYENVIEIQCSMLLKERMAISPLQSSTSTSVSMISILIVRLLNYLNLSWLLNI